MEDHLLHQEESDSEDEAGDSTPIARPEPPESKLFSLNDLISFPDKARCEFFFDTMAYHAYRTRMVLQNFKETMRMEASGEYPTNNVITELICLGALANNIMLDVEHVENELYVECPDLGESPYPRSSDIGQLLHGTYYTNGIT